MELSIEEARQEISGHLVEHIRNKTHPQARCCLAVADGYALAVLGEAAHDGACSYLVDSAVFVCDGEHCNDKADAIRAQIEALGKEG